MNLYAVNHESPACAVRGLSAADRLCLNLAVVCVQHQMAGLGLLSVLRQNRSAACPPPAKAAVLANTSQRTLGPQPSHLSATGPWSLRQARVQCKVGTPWSALPAELVSHRRHTPLSTGVCRTRSRRMLPQQPTTSRSSSSRSSRSSRRRVSRPTNAPPPRLCHACGSPRVGCLQLPG